LVRCATVGPHPDFSHAHRLARPIHGIVCPDTHPGEARGKLL
jgi:hypothetical protein